MSAETAAGLISSATTFAFAAVIYIVLMVDARKKYIRECLWVVLWFFIFLGILRFIGALDLVSSAWLRGISSTISVLAVIFVLDVLIAHRDDKIRHQKAIDILDEDLVDADKAKATTVQNLKQRKEAEVAFQVARSSNREQHP